MIRRMYVIIAILQVSCDLEYTADKMVHLLDLGLALAQCPVWKVIVVVEERRRKMTVDN